MSEPPPRSPWADPAYAPPAQARPPAYGAPQQYGPPHGPPQYGAPYGIPPAPPEVPGLGSPGRRLVARLIDMAISVTAAVTGAAVLAATTADADGEIPPPAIVGMFVIILGGIWGYEAVQLAVWGRTLGKRVMKLRVAPKSDIDAPLSGGRGLGRAAAYPLLFTVIGALPLIGLVNTLNVLWHLWDRPLRQCLHDKVAGTVVVDARVRP
ncbi:RDD family protein [Spirillospora sp. NPDC029432]|uniref:RDD family protein n=1 Tax=Spirillospora sp. NPDC029432 TaxID=3154599 RepID=UPI0034545C4F